MRLVKNSTRQMVLTVACGLVCLAQSGSAQSTYTWALSCSAATLGTGVSTGATWVWLHNGVQISYTIYGFASCATPPLSGSGEIPASINGIQVNGIEVDLSLSEMPAGCDAFASVKKSFDPSNPTVSIKASVKAPGSADIPFGGKVNCPSASFHFSLSN